VIILDTNVISELMRTHPETIVLQWLRQQNPEQLFLTAFTVAEIQRGLALLPAGSRKAKLESAFQTFLTEGFQTRILPFTERTIRYYVPLYTARFQAGLSVGELDLLIAAIAKENDATLATRNTKDFGQCGLRLINPWLQLDPLR